MIAGIVIAPGCFKRTKKTSTNAGESTYSSAKTTSIFDDELDAFVLEEDHNPFAPQSGDKVRLVKADLWSPEKRGEFEVIYFDFDQFKIRPDQENTLKRTLEELKKITKTKTIVLEGHACNSGGNAQYNMVLSEKRAHAVREYLIRQGIPAGKLKTVGHGSEQCVAIGGNQEQQAPNRRVAFVTFEEEAS